MVIKLFNPFYVEASLYFKVFQHFKPIPAEHRSHPPKVFLGNDVLQLIYWKTLMPKCDFNKVAKQQKKLQENAHAEK